MLFSRDEVIISNNSFSVIQQRELSTRSTNHSPRLKFSSLFYAVLQELVTEKLNVQQQSVELERLNEELEKVGLNREKLLQQEHTLDDR